MTDTENTVRCKAVTHPKVNGKYRAPGSTFDCPAHLVGELLELGAVVLAPADGPTVDAIEASAKAAATKTDDQAQARKEAIVAAITRLSPDNPDNWTADKKPQVRAIEAIAGFNISAGERDKAFESIRPQGE